MWQKIPITRRMLLSDNYNMRTLFMVLLLASLFGCARARVVDWHDQDFTVCGTPMCGDSCFKEKFNEVCQAGWQINGGYSSSEVVGAQTNMYGGTTLIRSNQSCSQVHCHGPLFQTKRDPASENSIAPELHKE
jgi:hypothetical protein